ncbi:6-bisphosphatase or related enzyme [Commensalibacter communis]|nr:6-bisphosphatase or related enzyme [Commensalibacter communis]
MRTKWSTLLFPHLIFFGLMGKSWFFGRLGIMRMRTRQEIMLHQAILHITAPESVEIYPNNRFDVLKDKVLIARYGGECYVMAMLAVGHIDICVEYSLQPYDIIL